MSDLRLVLGNLKRKGFRTALLVFTTMVGFLVFGGLSGFQDTIDASFDDIPANELVVSNAINFTQDVPIAYVNRVRALENVRQATYASWFGGYIEEPQNTVGAFAIDVDTYFDVIEEFDVSDEAIARFQADRSSILIPAGISEDFGWETGDAVTMFSNIYPQDDGSRAWPFVVAGVYPQDSGFPQVFLHYEYFNEARAFGRDGVGNIIIDTVSPDVTTQVSNDIDAMFFNSRDQTETITRSAFARSFLEQSISIGFIVTVISLAGFTAILLVVGNSMVVAIRERTREIAVMKTLGFQSQRIFRIVLAESFTIAVLGGLLGLAVVQGLFALANGAPDLPFPELAMAPETVGAAVVIMLALGLLTGFIPAFNALRLNVITALGRD